MRLKVALRGEPAAVDTITDLWPAADWYEREAWDMFGIGFRGHPHLRRILNPPWWEGHPLRKESPSRGTELGRFEMPPEVFEQWQEDLIFRPEEWGLPTTDDDPTLMYLNIGPQHGATHGPLRIIVGLRDEKIVALHPRHRLPPPRLREDERAPDLAHLHPVHRPHRLPRRRDQQPARGSSPWRSSAASRCRSAPR